MQNIKQNKKAEVYQWLEHNIHDYFQLVKVLKKKKSGEILLYKHRESGNYIVIKRLIGHYPAYEATLQIKHKNLVEVYEVAQEDKNCIIVEEFIDGAPLSFLLEKQLFQKEEVLKLGVQICNGLEALHNNHIVYRDLKPENIILTRDGIAKIIDYDIAKIYKQYAKKDTVILGTIGYAAPEQFGETQSNEKTDIYALGVLMNVLLTGEHPAKQIAAGKIGKIIEKCILVVPQKRFKDVCEVRKKLEKLYY